MHKKSNSKFSIDDKNSLLDNQDLDLLKELYPV